MLDEVRMQIAWRRRPYSSKVHVVTTDDQCVAIPVGKSTDLGVSMECRAAGDLTNGREKSLMLKMLVQKRNDIFFVATITKT